MARLAAFLIAIFLGMMVAHATWVTINLHPSHATNSRAYGIRSNNIAGYVDGEAVLWTLNVPGYVDLGPGIATNTDGVEQVGSRNNQACCWQGTAGSFASLLPNLTPQAVANGCFAGEEVGGVYSGFISQSWKAASWTGTAASCIIAPTQGSDYMMLQNTHMSQHVGAYHVSFETGLRPAIWYGINGTPVDLRPPTAYDGNVYGVYNGQQSGYVMPYATPNGTHAALWTNTMISMVDLAPPTGSNSVAYATYQGKQAGKIETPAKHAAFWQGTAASFFDLHSVLPPGFVSSEANGIWTDNAGVYTYVSGYAADSGGAKHAVIWKRIPDQLLVGTLNLQDTVNPFAFGRTITYRVEQGIGLITTGTLVATTPNSAFSIPVPFTFTGAVRLYFDGASFLQRRVNLTLTGLDQAVGTIGVANGDPDFSGEVDAADIDLVIAIFGFVGNTTADVDESGEVDAADIDVVIANFGAADQV